MPVTPASIRRLFLEPKRSYSAGEAADVFGMPVREVLAWIEAGELEAADGDGPLVTWSEVVSFAMDFWS